MENKEKPSQFRNSKDSPLQPESSLCIFTRLSTDNSKVVIYV